MINHGKCQIYWLVFLNLGSLKIRRLQDPEFLSQCGEAPIQSGSPKLNSTHFQVTKIGKYWFHIFIWYYIISWYLSYSVHLYCLIFFLGFNMNTYKGLVIMFKLPFWTGCDSAMNHSSIVFQVDFLFFLNPIFNKCF